jgi:hypothetical protein
MWADEVPEKYLGTIMKDLLTEPQDPLTEWQTWFAQDLKKVSRPKAVAHRAYSNGLGSYWDSTEQSNRSREVYRSWEDYKTKQTTSVNKSKKKTKVK